MQNLQEKYTAQDVAWLSIDSSAKGNQGYLKPQEAKTFIKDRGAKSTAFLLDASGEVGKLFDTFEASATMELSSANLSLIVQL